MKIVNYKYFIAILLFTGIIIAACESQNETKHINFETKDVMTQIRAKQLKKWAAEQKLQKEQDESDKAYNGRIAKMYARYIKSLKDYKATKHPIMFGWFNAWNPEAPDNYPQLDLIPDSLDIISIWGGPFNLSDKKKQQLKSVQEKGTKVVIGWIIENIGDQIVWDKSFWPNNPEEAVKAYATAICDTIKKYGYDGFDIDYEPSYSSPFKNGKHCGDWSTPWEKNKALISCSPTDNKDYENLFFKTMREKLGEDKILNINGSIHYLDPTSAKYFDYFTVQSYNGTYSNWTKTVMDRLGAAGVNKSQIIYTETFQNNKGNINTFKNYANFVVNTMNREAGGIGAFHINEDAFSNVSYQHVREAIQIMNPSNK